MAKGMLSAEEGSSVWGELSVEAGMGSSVQEEREWETMISQEGGMGCLEALKNPGNCLLWFRQRWSPLFYMSSF